MAARIWARSVYLNYPDWDTMAPFGGYKQSGLGRESGQESIKEFMQTKSVWMSYAEDTPNPFIMR